MRMLPYIISVIAAITILSCTGSNRRDHTLKQMAASPRINKSLRRYRVYVPEGWVEADTVIEGMKIKFLFAPIAEGYGRTNMNILNEAMLTNTPEAYVDRSIEVLERDVEQFHLTARNQFQASGLNGIWFSYTKKPNGIAREAITYTVFDNHIAYILTATTDHGRMAVYRSQFDSIARSFRFVE